MLKTMALVRSNGTLSRCLKQNLIFSLRQHSGSSRIAKVPHTYLRSKIYIPARLNSTTTPIFHQNPPLNPRHDQATSIEEGLKADTSKMSDDERIKRERKEGWANLPNLSAEERERLMEEESQQIRKSATRRGNNYGLPIIVIGALVGSIVYFGWWTATKEQVLLRQKTAKENAVGVVPLVWADTRTNVAAFIDSMADSDSSILLPPRSKPPPGYISLEPKYTIVIEPLNILLLPEYDLERHWRFKKLPGMKKFMDTVGWNRGNGSHNDMEMVLWTNKPMFEAQGYVESLISEDGLAIPLFREACRYKPGFSSMDISQMKAPTPYYQKPLENLGRDLSKTIIIDTDPKVYEEYPENGLCIKPASMRTSQGQDLTLQDLTTFLQYITNVLKPDDVRPIIRRYSKYGDQWLEEFRKNREKAQQMKEESAMQTQPVASNFARFRTRF